MSFPVGHKGFRTSESYRRSAEKLAAIKDVQTRFKKGMTPWNKGKQGVMPEPWNKGKVHESVVGEGNVQWKGEEASYFAKHSWMVYHHGNPRECEECGVKGKKNGRQWSIHWANISGQFLRDLADWKKLCVSCHRRFDNARRKNVPSMTA